MTRKSIKFNFIMNMIRTIMSVLFPLITFPYSSRILLSEGIGKANFVVSVVSYFQLFAALGITTYAITEGAKIRDDKKKLSIFATEIFCINLISTLISYICFFVVITLPFFEEYRTLLIISSLNIIFSTISIEWLYGILEEYRYITIRSIIFQFISLILLFILVRDRSDIPQYVALTVISAAGSGILNFIHSRKYIKLFSYKICVNNLKQHIKPIITIFGMSVASTIYLNIDTTLLGIMKGDTAVGVYSAAIKIFRIVCLIIGSLSAVLLPRLSYYISINDKEKFNSLVKKTIHFMLALIIPSMIGMFLLSEEIILIISGVDFIEAIPTMRIMTLNLLLSPINGFLAYQIFMPYRKEKVSFFATVLGSIANIIANLILIPLYSHTGAVIATLIAEGIVLFVCLYNSRKIINITMILKGAWQYVLAALPIILVYKIIDVINIENIFIKTLLIIILGIVVYLINLLVLKNNFLLEILNQFKQKSKVLDR